MIRNISSKDKLVIADYLVSKKGISFLEANKIVKNILKGGRVSFIKENKECEGICYIYTKEINGEKLKFIEILVNNWRLAENYLQMLKWSLNGVYFFSLPKHDFLNRTYNKNNIKFLQVDGQNNIYSYKFEKRQFFNFKREDIED